MTPLKLCIGIPAYPGYIDAMQAQHFLCIGEALQSHTWEDAVDLLAIDTLAGSLIQVTRNVLLFAALERGAHWLVMVDADTYVDYNDDAGTQLLRMVFEGDRRNAAIIAAPVCIADPDGNATAKSNASASFGPQRLTVRELPRGVFRAAIVGSAYMALNCTWFREHWPESPWFDITWLEGTPPRFQHGEDVHLCREVADRGGLILCDGRVRPVHAPSRRILHSTDAQGLIDAFRKR
jgi:hypothetical protein